MTPRLQHTRLLCPPLCPRVCSNSCPLSWWFYLTISTSATPFSFCLQSFPGSRSFLMSRLLTSGGQSIGVSASASVLLVNIQGWFPLGLIDWFDLLQSKELSWVFSSTTIQKHQFFGLRLIFLYKFIYFNWRLITLQYSSTLTSHDSWKNHSFDYMDVCQQSDVSAL